MIFRPRLTLIGFPSDHIAEASKKSLAAAREVAIRNRALENTLRAKRTETHDRLRSELGGL